MEVANQAVELVAHNGDKFDIAWIRTRCLYHRIPMFPHYTSIDTLKIVRSKFRLNSNRLNYVAKFLNLGQKIHTDFDLWKDILLNKDAKAMDKMIKYCKQDVALLEKVYHELKSHVEPKTHHGVLFGADRGSCPECGSDELVVSLRRTTVTGLKKIQYRCNTCNRFHTKTDK